MTVTLLLGPAAATTGPTLEVTRPLDGAALTTTHVTVEGCASAPMRSISLDVPALGTESVSGLAMHSGALKLVPVKRYSEDFNGFGLNPSDWTVVNASGNITVTNGELLMFSYPIYSRPGLIKSARDVFPKGTDYTAEIKLKFDYIGYIGCGGGITKDALDLKQSTAAAYYYYNTSQPYWYTIFAHDRTFEVSEMATDHILKLSYTKATDRYEVRMDDDAPLLNFTTTVAPERFWFGCVDPSWDYYGSYMRVDYADIWSYSGSWTSNPYDFGHNVSVEGLSPVWSTTDTGSAKVSWEARFSADNATWSDWASTAGIGTGSPKSARWMQLRAFASLPVKNADASLTLSSVDVSYRDPLVSVEVRTGVGAWIAASGLALWTSALDLVEDANVIEVRATDSSGAVNSTSISVIVDTTRPMGTMSIQAEHGYINDLNVTLLLNASDRYGVQYVQVSSAPDMFNKLTFPYAPTLRWRMEGGEGEVFVYVRFVDAHGLLSDIVGGSILYDSIPPTAAVRINGGAAYSPSETVNLTLDYADTRGVAQVELSNAPDFSDVMTVTVGTHAVERWALAEGGDGPRIVHMRVTDVAGNKAVVSGSIEVYLPKAVGSVTIEGGATVTKKTIVSLKIEAPPVLRAARMQISNDAAFIGASWEAYDTAKLWFVSAGDGPKIVFARFEDFRGIVSLPINASILLDTAPPVLVVALEGGAKYTTATNLTARISYEDASPATRMWLAPDDRVDLAVEQAFEAEFGWDVPGVEGDHYLYVKVEDSAGNTAIASGHIHYSKVKPVLTLRLPGGAIAGAGSTVAVTASATDPYGGVEVQLAFDGDPAPTAPWLRVNASLSVSVPSDAADGIHEVRARARNAAGLVSEVTAVSIKVDRTPPKLEVVEPLDGSRLPQKGKSVLLEFTASDESGLGNITYRADNGNWSHLGIDQRSAVMVLKGYGRHTIEVVATDVVGNPKTATTTFTLEESSTTVSANSAAMVGIAILLLVIVIVALALFMRKGRKAKPSPRQVDGAPPAPADAPLSGPAPVGPQGGSPVQERPSAPEGDRKTWEEF
jgi:hypothetical protein